MATFQAFGTIFPNGNIECGSGNFSVQKISQGRYKITLKGSSPWFPVAVVTPHETELPAHAIVSGGGSGASGLYFEVTTGFITPTGAVTVDLIVSFVAFWIQP